MIWEEEPTVPYFKTGKPKVCKISKGDHDYELQEMHPELHFHPVPNMNASRFCHATSCDDFGGKYIYHYRCVGCGKKSWEVK